MSFSAAPRSSLLGDVSLLLAIASLLWVAHFILGDGYGFHRDELQFLEDARHLEWGFVAYPPLTAFLGRIAVDLFGVSPHAFRLPAVLANSITVVLAGLIARELGAARLAQVLTALAVLPVALADSSVLQYNTFDLLAWTMIVLFMARVLKSGDERNWLGVGTGIGLGILSKYSIALPVLSLVVALAFLPSQRRQLRSRWFWLAGALALLIGLPNLVWLFQHHFITLQMEHFIHERDVRHGRADGYYMDQLRFTLLAAPLAVMGLVWLVRSNRFRLLAAFWIGPFLLFAALKGRGYYLLPAYPVLYAAGAVQLQQFLSHGARWRTLAYAGFTVGMLGNVAIVAYTYLPLWRSGTPHWKAQVQANSDLADEVGWPELTAAVANVYASLSVEDRSRVAIVADNYGEAGALALYGPAYHLPTVVSRSNSFFYRGLAVPEPAVVIVAGSSLEGERNTFGNCIVAGHIHVPFNVKNEESIDHPDILVCRQPLRPWKELWGTEPDFG